MPWTKEDLQKEGCTCTYEFKSGGRLYGVPFMKTWIRMNDADDCPLHGKERIDALEEK